MHYPIHQFFMTLVLVTSSTPAIAAQAGGQQPVPVPVEFPEDLLTPTASYYNPAGMSHHFTARCGFLPGAYGFTLAWRERDPALQPDHYGFWKNSEFFVSTTFRITDVASREGGDEVYVSGIRDDGRGVIKKFLFSPRDHGQQIQTVPTTIEPLGTPMPSHQSEVLTVNPPWQGRFTASRGTPVRRHVLGDLVGLVRQIAIDPHGRYLLMLTHEDTKIYRLDLIASPNTVEELYTGADIAGLAAMRSLKILRVNSGGQVAIMTNIVPGFLGAGIQRAALFDEDNDGVFDEAHSFASHTELTVAGFGYDDTTEPWNVDVSWW